VEIFTPTTVACWGILGTTLSSFGVLMKESPAVSDAVPFGVVLTGVVVTATLVWKVAHQKHTVDLNIKDLENRIESLEEQLAASSKRKDKQDKSGQRR